MKKAWIIAWTLLFVSVAGFADGPAPSPLSDEALAAILGGTAAGRSCATQAGGVRPAAVQGQKGICSVTCPASTVSVNCNGTCTSVDRNCAILEPGHVTCNGDLAGQCPPCPCPSGTSGSAACCRCDETGDCFDCCRCSGGSPAQCALSC